MVLKIEQEQVNKDKLIIDWILKYQHLLALDINFLVSASSVHGMPHASVN